MQTGQSNLYYQEIYEHMTPPIFGYKFGKSDKISDDVNNLSSLPYLCNTSWNWRKGAREFQCNSRKNAERYA